jgi:hypothetical protein
MSNLKVRIVALPAWVEHIKYKAEYCNRTCLEESPNLFKGDPNGFAIELYEPIRE